VSRRGEKDANTGGFSLFFSISFFFAASDFFNKWWVPRLHVPLPHEVALHAFTDKIKI
jgi:hypothetical protein